VALSGNSHCTLFCKAASFLHHTANGRLMKPFGAAS